MSIELIFILALFLLIIVILVFIEPIFSKHKIKSNNEYGSARFATKEEIEKNFTKEKISKINEVGFPVWFDKKVKHVWFDKETPHYVYLGSSGSGKSVTSVIPMVSFIATAKIKRSVFITDPKGEIYSSTSKMLKDNGYKIFTIDFRRPELSNHINILEPIINEYDNYIKYENKSKNEKSNTKKLKYNNYAMSSLAEANRLVTSLAMMLTEEEQTKDPFWNNSAKNLLEGLISFFLEEYKLGKIKRNQITMTSIKKFQVSTMNEKNHIKFKRYIESKEYGTKSKDNLIPILTASENTYKSITSVFGEKMAIFDDINVANVTCKSDFNMNILGKEKTALFVIVPDEDKVYYKLVTLIVGMLYKELVKLANSNSDKKLNIGIDWLLDEFANCPPLTDIEAIVSVARSRGMRFHFFIQSLSQLNNVYGKEVAQIILDNAGLTYLKTNTIDTAEEISKRLGKKTIESNSISQSMSLLDYNGNKSVSLMARDLLTPDEVKNLHYKTIIFSNIGFPIFRDTVIYKKLSCYKEGEVKRKTNVLLDLEDTYFTVEKLILNKRNLVKKEESMDEFDDFRNFQIEKLNPAIFIIKNIVKHRFKELDFKSHNGRIYAIIYLNEKIGNREMVLIKGRINRDSFHLEINDKVIEIHIKNILNNSNEIIENSKNIKR